jgi:hypothetical protein
VNKSPTLIIFSLLLAACGGPAQENGPPYSTDGFWKARQDQSVTLLDRNGLVVYDRFELLDGDRYCEAPTPQTTCIELLSSTEPEARTRVEHYGRQLERQGWQPLLTGNQYSHEAGNGCRAIVAVGATIRPDSSIDWSEIVFVQSLRCEERAQ